MRKFRAKKVILNGYCVQERVEIERQKTFLGFAYGENVKTGIYEWQTLSANGHKVSWIVGTRPANFRNIEAAKDFVKELRNPPEPLEL